MNSAKIKATFTEIFQKRVWGEENRESGPGNDPVGCLRYTRFVRTFFGGDIIADIGCGDCILWDSVLPGRFYYGVDVVSDLITRNKIRCQTPASKFECAEFFTYTAQSIMQASDVVLLKDVLQHLPLDDIKYILAYLIRLSDRENKRIVITNEYDPTFEGSNSDIQMGGMRPIALKEPPFNLDPLFYFEWANTRDKNKIKQTVVL